MTNFPGFDIGGTSIRSVALSRKDSENQEAENSFFDHRQILRPESNEGLLEALAEIVSEHQPNAVGVGCAGFVTHEGVVVQSPNIASLVNFPLRSALEEKLRCPVVVENDAAAAAWAEAKAGAGRGVSNIAFVGFGTGIGGALVIDGKLVRGVHGFGSEPGHLTVVPDGLECPCGRRGCWELYASGSALGRYARDAAERGDAPELIALAGAELTDSPTASAASSQITGEHVALLLASTSPAGTSLADTSSSTSNNIAHALLSELCDWIAMGLNTLVVLTDPEMVVLGGGLSEMGKVFLHSVEEAYTRRYTSRDTRPSLSFALAEHTETAGAVGAALLGAQHWHSFTGT